MVNYFEALDWDKKPKEYFFKVSSDQGKILVEACLGFQPGGWQPFLTETFELFRQAGIVEVTLEHINDVRKKNNLPIP